MPLPIALFVLASLAIMFALGLAFVGRALFDDQAMRSIDFAEPSRPAEPQPGERPRRDETSEVEPPPL